MIGIILKTHFFNRSILEKLLWISRDMHETGNTEIILAIDVTKVAAGILEHINSILPNITIFPFDSALHLRHGFAKDPVIKWRRCSVNWYHNDYSILALYLERSGRYDALWQIEYDVYLRHGSWKFLAADYSADFMASSIRVKSPELTGLVDSTCIIRPQWYWWKKLRGCDPTVGSFFPCVRLSANAMKTLVDAYRNGVYGYCEVSVPSVLGSHGLKISDISVIPAHEAEIYHPHWRSDIKDNIAYDFMLNSPELNIDD